MNGAPAISAVAATLVATLVGCESADDPIVFDLRGQDEVEVVKTFDVDGSREVHVVNAGSNLVEMFVERGTIDGDAWRTPHVFDGSLVTVEGDGEVTMHVWTRGNELSPVKRDRSLAWFDASLLDNPDVISFASVIAAIGGDGHGGALLDRWFRAFAAGPGAGRATFAQFLDGIVTTQGADPTKWNLATLPFKVTGIHNRVDLANAEHCGELRVSIASTHPTFSPVHLIFLFRQPAREVDDITPDGVVHCRGTARLWARLSAMDDSGFRIQAQQLLKNSFTRARFLLAESVELSISPWQWRQWTFDASGTPANPPLFQTIDVERVNTPGPTRDAFVAAVSANASAVDARTWAVPAMFRSAVAEVQPNSKATLVDVASPETARALSMIGCPRCHTDDADFLQTGIDRKVSPFYDRELDARAARMDALGRGERPDPPPFGPLQPL